MTARWTGFTGAPGYSAFHFASGFLDGGLIGDEAEVLAARVADAFEALAPSLPTNVRISIDPEVPVIDSDTGIAQSFNTIEPPPQVSGSGTGGYAGPTGAVVTWRTNDLRAGRRIRGRTFLVPLASVRYENNGTLTVSALTELRAFADTMIGSSLQGDFGVWSRPVGGSGGVFASVTSATIPDMAAVLRTRRD